MTDRAPDGPALKSAGIWRRFMSMVYEGVILFGVLFFFGYGFSALLRLQGQPGMLRDLFQWFLLLLLGLYFTWFWSLGRRSLPMKTVAVLVVDRQSKPISTLRAMLRFIVAGLLGLLPLALAAKIHFAFFALALLPLAWCLIDPDRQALYDRLCGTRLVISDPKAQTSDLRSDLLADPAHQPGKTGDQSFTQSTK